MASTSTRKFIPALVQAIAAAARPIRRHISTAKRTRTFKPDFEWFDIAPADPSVDYSGLLGLNSFESGPHTTGTYTEWNEGQASNIRRHRDVDLEFLSVDSLIEEATYDNGQASRFAISALPQFPSRPRQQPDPFVQPKRRKRKSLWLLGQLLFFGSSAITGLAIALIIFKVVGIDPFGLGGFLVGHSNQ